LPTWPCRQAICSPSTDGEYPSISVLGATWSTIPRPRDRLQGSTITLGSGGFPAFAQARTYSFGAQVFDLTDAVITGGMRKFVNDLPGLGAGAANSLGQYIPVAVPDTTTYPGSDYYVIELDEYTEQMHSDLPAHDVARLPSGRW
jgi:hypothetical protein